MLIQSSAKFRNSTTPLSRTPKGPEKLVRLNESPVYPSFVLSQTLLI